MTDNSRSVPGRLPRAILRRLAALAWLLVIGGGAPAFAAAIAPPAGNAGGGAFQGIGLPPVLTAPPAGAPAWAVGSTVPDPVAVPVAVEARTPIVHLPAPAALWLFGSGLCALGLARRRIAASWRRRNRRHGRSGEMPRPNGPLRPLRVALRERIRHAAAGGACSSGSQPPPAAPPQSAGGHGNSAPSPGGAPAVDLLQCRFEELAAALVEQPGVVPGRSFGLPCLKFGKRPFLVLDAGNGGIAFRVGETAAQRLLADLPQVGLWNPKGERQPKLSWLATRVGNGEMLVHLAASAYEQALQDAPAAAGRDRVEERATELAGI